MYKTYDLMVLLSGPEPQRSILEERLLEELKKFEGKVLFVKGKVESNGCAEKISYAKANLTIVNFMRSAELETSINQSKTILSRSGYTTVMDLAKLEKKAFFIPTPGQYEQEYIAKRLQKQGLVPYSDQDSFSLDDLEQVKNYTGLANFDSSVDFSSLFSAFSSVKENSEPTSSSLST